MEICGYVITAMALAAVLMTLFNPNSSSDNTLNSTAAGADVVFVVFIWLVLVTGRTLLSRYGCIEEGTRRESKQGWQKQGWQIYAQVQICGRSMAERGLV